MVGRTLSRSKFDVPNAQWNSSQFVDNIIDTVSLKSAEKRGKMKERKISGRNNFKNLKRSETEYAPSNRSSNSLKTESINNSNEDMK